MSSPLQPVRPQEDTIKGALFALAIVPVIVVIEVLLSSLGIAAAIVGFVAAIGAVWLYRKGSGGLVSRTGAWVVTGIVIVSVLLGFWAAIAVDLVGGIGHLARLADPRFPAVYSAYFGAEVKANAVYYGLGILFAALGAFRTLGRAFSTARQPVDPEAMFGAPVHTQTDPRSTAAQPYTQQDSTGTVSSSPDERIPPASTRE